MNLLDFGLIIRHVYIYSLPHSSASLLQCWFQGHIYSPRTCVIDNIQNERYTIWTSKTCSWTLYIFRFIWKTIDNFCFQRVHVNRLPINALVQTGMLLDDLETCNNVCCFCSISSCNAFLTFQFEYLGREKAKQLSINQLKLSFHSNELAIIHIS